MLVKNLLYDCDILSAYVSLYYGETHNVMWKVGGWCSDYAPDGSLELADADRAIAEWTGGAYYRL